MSIVSSMFSSIYTPRLSLGTPSLANGNDDALSTLMNLLVTTLGTPQTTNPAKPAEKPSQTAQPQAAQASNKPVSQQGAAIVVPPPGAPTADGNGRYAGKNHTWRGTAYDKQIIGQLRDELGLKRKDAWAAAADKGDGKVKHYSANGSVKAGALEKGDILEIQSAKLGTVRIEVGGDGALDGGDDRVFSVGGKSAAESIGAGLNAVNSNPATTTAQAKTTSGQAPTANMTASSTTASQKAPGIFSDSELRNLIAAIIHQLLYASQNQSFSIY